MEIINKSPQELAAQAINSYPSYGNSDMPEIDSKRFEAQTTELRSELENIEPLTLSDAELTGVLDEMLADTKASGALDPTKGQGAEVRKQYSFEKFKNYGYSDEVAKKESLKNLSHKGYVNAVRYYRKTKERAFKDPVTEFIENTPITAHEEEAQIGSLMEKMIDISTITPKERDKISQDFPSGNYVYHGTGTEQLIKILDSGELVSSSILHEREKQAADKAGRTREPTYNNSGYEGISWSMNGIDALPGDRYHMAGFVVAPETILDEETQLAIPSRPAPNEVIQIPASIDAADYYETKTQFELYRDVGLGESNSVFGNLLAINRWEDKDKRPYFGKPLLYLAKEEFLSKPGFEDKLRGLYNIDENNSIRLSPDLLQQNGESIPPAAVWIQAAIDTNRLKNTPLEGKDLARIIDNLDKDSISNLLSIAREDWRPHEEKLDNTEDKCEGVSISVKDMYFVAPRKDARHWLKVLSRSAHKPAGIMLYDDKKIRLENFATLHRGNHSELSEELSSVITPKEEYIDYNKVLGSEFTDDMRTGSKHHVIAERHLMNRRNIKNIDGKLVLGD